MSIHEHTFGHQKSDPTTTSPTSLSPSTVEQIDRLKTHKADFDRQLTALCRQLAQMVNDIESLRSLNDQLFRASVNQVLQQQKQKQRRAHSPPPSSSAVITAESTQSVEQSAPPNPPTTTMNSSLPRRNSAQSNSSDSSTMSVASSSSSASRASSVSPSSAPSETADDDLDQLTLEQIDDLPSQRLNYFINLLYEAAVAGVATGKDDFLGAFELLCRDECCELVITENGLDGEEEATAPPDEQEAQSAESSSASTSDNESFPVVQCAYEMPDNSGEYAEPDGDFEMVSSDDDAVFMDRDEEREGANGEEQDDDPGALSSPSVYEDSFNQSFVTAETGDDSDASSLVDEVEVMIPESPKEAKGSFGNSPTNSSSAVSSASTSPSSETQDEPVTMINTEVIDIPPRADYNSSLTKRSSFNLHSSSSSTISNSPPSESTSTFSEPRSPPIGEEAPPPPCPVDNREFTRQKTVDIKGYDETGKMTIERVVLRPVQRSKTFATSHQSRPTVTIREPLIELAKSPDVENMSFANRRNMWERRSLGRGYKFRAGA